ncbi:MAG: c-type cytochrome domain-containing protein [Pirellulaceae bacterium]
MRRHFWLLAWACCGVLLVVPGRSPLLADGSSESIDYVRQVKPILESRCYACHGALKQEAGLRVDTAAAIIAGGDSGAAIAPSDSSASLLLTRIAATDEFERMPPGRANRSRPNRSS